MIKVLKQIILKYKLKKNKTPWIKVHKDTIQKYKYTTNRNSTLSDFQIAFKINRSYYSGTPDSINWMREFINYGRLKVHKDNRTNIITDIHNGSSRNGRIDFGKKDTITSIYLSVFGCDI